MADTSVLKMLWFANYNNYYDRIIKRDGDTIDEVITYAQTSGYTSPILSSVQNINFNPNDGVDTEIIVNVDSDQIGNYIFVCPQTSSAKIESRWFIIESVRVRAGQYRLQLHRDLVCDYYDSVIDLPCFIEKATLPDSDDAIFNSEDMTFDQIKTKETLLTDETGGAWVVGYIPQDAFSTDTDVKTESGLPVEADYTASDGIESWEVEGITPYDYVSDNTFWRVPSTDYVNFNFYQTKDYIDYYIGGSTTYPSTRKMTISSSNGSFANNPWDGLSKPRVDYYDQATYPDEALQPAGEYNALVLPDSEPLNTWTVPTPFASEVNGVTKGEALTDIVKLMYSTGMIGSTKTYSTLSSLIGKTVKDEITGRYYKISLVTTEETLDDSNVGYLEYGSSVYNAMVDFIANYGGDNIKYVDIHSTNAYNAEHCFGYVFNQGIVGYKVVFEALDTSAGFTLSPTRNKLADSPYDMFCIPYSSSIRIFHERISDSTLPYGSYEHYITGNEQLAQRAAIAIGQELSEKYIYDLQLLPYCPARELIKSDGTLSFDGTYSSYITVPGYYALIKTIVEMVPGSSRASRSLQVIQSEDTTLPETTTTTTTVTEGGITTTTTVTTRYQWANNDHTVPISALIWCSSSSFNFQIEMDDPIVITDYKTESQTDMYRLVSPNYSGQFEFNAAKNGGVSEFDVYCTYKPFNPYISVRPNFGRLYGKNFADGRGLICGGDFSMPQVTDPWTEYQYNNKNYENIFNRQIENMEIQNKYSRAQDIVGGISGLVSGAASLAVPGALTKAMPGSLIGGIAGAGLSLTGGIMDININESLRNETLDYTKDLFGYQLGNIKAQAQSLAKASALTINNKLFPFLEYYTCSDVQKRALKNKVEYDGMTVMRIGTISEFLQEDYSYIKGKIIRFNKAISDDYHLATSIADEINKGVFIRKE